MKFIKSIFAFATIFAVNSVAAQSLTEKWPQIKAYHEIMSKTFHPAEEGNLEPIRKDAESLLEKANALTVENMPAEFRSPKLNETLIVLKKETKVVTELVKQKASDNEITKALTKLHDIFHQIVGLCQPEKK